MVKIDIAFDEVENINNIRELSVVFYLDSFFYGLWDHNETLVKSDNHDISNFGKIVKMLNKTYDFKISRVMSTIKPFVHLPREEYNKKYFNAYFDGIYDTSKRTTSRKEIDDFLREEINTLHYIDKSVLKVLSASNLSFKKAHISTALASYAYLVDEELICYVESEKLHISYVKDGQFQLYNQYYCEQAEDYLYYILLVMKHFNLDPNKDSLSIGGYIYSGFPLINLLQSYIKEVQLVDDNINVHKNNERPKNYYYDLYLCKTCV